MVVKVKKTAPQKTGRRKHVPQRTCVGCRAVQSKRTLVRIVRTPQGVKVDLTGKLNGRGAYLHDQKSCWERGLKGALAHALKTELSPEDREHLFSFMSSLADENVPEDVGDGE